MVVKVSMREESHDGGSRRTAQRVLKKYGLASTITGGGGGGGGMVAKRSSARCSSSSSSSSSDGSYWRLKRIVPAISDKENISKLDVVLEAISYIRTLQGDLSRSAPTSPTTSPAAAAATAASPAVTAK